QTQILFLDQSTMTVGPGSELTIDEFVFDPAAGTGKMAASLTRGVFRLVGGKLSKQDNAVSMQTPSATIGIRGGVVLVNAATGGNGGATIIPTEAMVADSGIAQAIQQGPIIVVQTQPPNVNTAVQLAQTQLQVTANQPPQLAANQTAQIGGGTGGTGGGGGTG